LQDIDTVFLVWLAPPDAIEGALEKITRHARRTRPPCVRELRLQSAHGQSSTAGVASSHAVS